MNPLNEYPAARKVAYLIQWIANLATGVLSIVFLNDSVEGVPGWFTMTVLILAFVWTYTGLTAQQNVDTPSSPDRGAVNLVVVLLVLILTVVLLLLLGFGANVNIR